MKSFKDFWTHDLNKFYDESWGQENYDHRKVQSSMPVAQDKWKVIPADRFRNKDRSRGPFCTECKERGHIQYECPKLRNPKCYICGQNGHFYYKCPNAVCTTCRSAAVYHTATCFNCHRVKHLQCNLCKTMGHEANFCPDKWRRYHQTTEHTVKWLNKSNMWSKDRNKLWCPNCANQGHSAERCPYPRQDRILSSTEIFCYEAAYDIELEQPRKLSVTDSSSQDTKKNNSVVEVLSEDSNEFSNEDKKKNDFIVEISSGSSANESSEKTDLELDQSCESRANKEKIDSEGRVSDKFSPKKYRKMKNRKEVQPIKIKKYKNVLNKLKKKCKTSDSDSLERIAQYMRAIRNKTFNKTSVEELIKFREQMKFKSRQQMKMMNS